MKKTSDKKPATSSIKLEKESVKALVVKSGVQTGRMGCCFSHVPTQSP